MKTVLLVEDDIDIMRINRSRFLAAGYKVLEAETIRETKEILAKETPDVIVLDIILPDGDGLELCQELRGESGGPPILFLSGKRQPEEIVAGLEAGGDAYLPKPYKMNVLLAQAEALMRRTDRTAETLTKGLLTLNITAGIAYINGEDLLLPQKEFALLVLFARNEEKTMSAEYLYEKVWKAPINEDANAVRYHISMLRKKLTGSGYAITMTRGEGYTFGKK
jgi:DNA-binding response OmpR family regulator